MKKLPWDPSKDLIRVSANNLGIDIDRAIYTAMAFDYSLQSTERAKKNDIVRLGMCNVNIRKVFKEWCKPDETNEDALAYTKAMNELGQMAARTKDSIADLLAKMSAAMH